MKFWNVDASYRPWRDISRHKLAQHPKGVLGEPRDDHTIEWLPWRLVLGNPWDHSGELVLPMLFDVAVESVVQHWLSLKMEDGAVFKNLLVHTVGRILGALYADNGILGSRDPEWLLGALHFLIGIFHQINLAENGAKSKIMICQLVAIILGVSEEVFAWCSTGEGEMYWENLRIIVPCPDFRLDIMDISLTYHHQRFHSTKPRIEWYWMTVRQNEHLLQVYIVGFPHCISN